MKKGLKRLFYCIIAILAFTAIALLAMYSIDVISLAYNNLNPTAKTITQGLLIVAIVIGFIGFLVKYA